MTNRASNICGGHQQGRRAGACSPPASPFLTPLRLDDDQDDDTEDDDEFEDEDDDDDEEEDDEEVPETWQVERTTLIGRPDSRLTSDIELPRLAPSFRLS